MDLDTRFAIFLIAVTAAAIAAAGVRLLRTSILCRRQPCLRHLRPAIADVLSRAGGYLLLPMIPIVPTLLYATVWHVGSEWKLFLVSYVFINSLHGYFRIENLAKGAKNRLRFLQDVQVDGQPVWFALYLRDRFGEERTFHASGPELSFDRLVPLQVGATRLRATLSQFLPLVGLWCTGDERSGPPFAPLLSSDATWQSDVATLADRCVLICVDIEKTSAGVRWEAEFLERSPSLLAKTLVVISQNEVPRALLPLTIAARWKVSIGNRREPGDEFEPLKLPNSCVHYIRSVCGLSYHDGAERPP